MHKFSLSRNKFLSHSSFALSLSYLYLSLSILRHSSPAPFICPSYRPSFPLPSSLSFTLKISGKYPSNMSPREHSISRAKLLVISKFICEVRNVFRANTVKDKEEDNKEIWNKHKHFVLRNLHYWRISHLTRKQQWDDEKGLNRISLLSSHWQVYPISKRHAVKTKRKRLFVNGYEMEEKDFYSGGIVNLVPRDRANGSTWSAIISKYSDTSVQWIRYPSNGFRLNLYCLRNLNSCTFFAQVCM